MTPDQTSEAAGYGIFEPGDTRYHHYAFAHVVLSMAALEDPAQTLVDLGPANSREYLNRLFELTSEMGRGQGFGDPDFNASDIGVLVTTAAGLPCIVVRMPPPRRRCEAHMVAMVFRDLEGTSRAAAESMHVRVFTLEHSDDEDGVPRTVICSWDEEGNHFNYGEGPPPVEDAFVAAVDKRLSRFGFYPW